MNIQETGVSIRERRKRLGIDQRSLAEIAGVSEHTIVNIESGQANPTFRILLSVADALGMEIVVRVRETPLGRDEGE